MRIATTAERLNQLMSERNLRQVDILERAKPFCETYKIKLTKSDLSQFVSGKYKSKSPQSRATTASQAF